MNAIFMKIRTAWRLGLPNVSRVLIYRVSLVLGWQPVKKLVAVEPKSPFFNAVLNSGLAFNREESFCGHESKFSGFGLITNHNFDEGVPDWHKSILTGVRAPYVPWWRIPDFLEALGDIKGVWEASRFDWVLILAKQALKGDGESIFKLNEWLDDWCCKNPPYIGANWKCGQEASIRVMHLAISALLLNQAAKPAPGLIELLRIHLQRIAPTIQYAIAQDNNHGTSEAAALFIGGSWLASLSDEQGKKWERIGRKWLENRARRLIEVDGSFSQYSLNYHRVMLDTYSIAEVWRREMQSPAFSSMLVSRLQVATAWLGNMVSPDGSDTPNLGSNDGARLLPLSDTDYRDVRPSVQLASVLFTGCRAYKDAGSYDLPLQLLGLPLPGRVKDYRESRLYDEGGFAVMRKSQAMALLRYPRFRFRPGQCDLLHLDLWKGGVNLLRDAGTYSYNCDEPWQSYFKSMEAHNTVQFDGRDAMPKLSRFLYGAWPKANHIEFIAEERGLESVAAAYRDWLGAEHHRLVQLDEHTLHVVDLIGGFSGRATLRWRLAPGEWRWEDDWLVSGHDQSRVQLKIQGSMPITRYELVEGWESRYYSQKTPLPVLEVEVAEAGTLTTELRF